MSPDRKLIFGLYATTPDPLSAESRFDVELIRRARSEMLMVGGLEVPYYGRPDTGEKYAETDLLEAMDAGWTNVITTVPAAMLHQKENAKAGLASRDESGRVDAVRRIRGATELIRRMNDKFGRKSVTAVQVCSSPSSSASADRSSADSLRRSLEELSSHDWDGAGINVEHCDAKTGRSLEKALLSLDDEISGIQSANEAGADCGVVINWGRSAIEFRDGSRVIEHIEAARSTGLLRGVMFSGATDDAASPYGFWKDTHPAVALPGKGDAGVPESLLTASEMSDALERAGPDEQVFLGCKIHITPASDHTLDRAISFNRATAEAILGALQHSSAAR